MQSENGQEFTRGQIKEIHKGLLSRVDTLQYANPDYSVSDMRKIRESLEKKKKE